MTVSSEAGATKVVLSEGEFLFSKGTTIRVFSLFFVMMILDFADRMIVASLLPSIKAEWNITDAQAGLLNSALFVGMVIFSIPASIAIDRWSRVKTAALMGALWSFASGAGAFALTLSQLAMSRAAVGVAQAGYTPAAAAWIMAAFPKRRVQLALGTFSAGQPIGMALGVALGGYITSHYGWRHALGIMAIPGFFVAILLYRARDYKNPVLPAAGQPGAVPPATVRASLARIFKTPTLPWIYVNSAMVLMQMASVAYFLPSFLTRFHGVELQTASYMTGSAVLMGIIGAPLGGWISDLWTTRYREAKVVFAMITATLSTLFFGIAFGLATDLMVQYGLVLGAVFMITAGASGPLAVSQELVHPGIRALSMTCNALAGHLLGSVPGPLLTGIISDHTDLKFALLCAAMFSGTVAVLSLYLAKRNYLRDLDNMPRLEVAAD